MEIGHYSRYKEITLQKKMQYFFEQRYSPVSGEKKIFYLFIYYFKKIK